MEVYIRKCVSGLGGPQGQIFMKTKIRCQMSINFTGGEILILKINYPHLAPKGPQSPLLKIIFENEKPLQICTYF